MAYITSPPFNGTDLNATIYGSDDHDVINGYGGDDYIEGRAGNDTIYGGPGDDEIHGDGGDDLIYGEDGDDRIYGGSGKDTIYGGDGDDKIYGGDGQDLIYGGAGHDSLDGGKGDDTVYGGPGNDTLYGRHGDDLLYGDEGNDVLYGDGYLGDSGNDTLIGGPGNDTLYGGDGNNTFVFNPGDGLDTIVYEYYDVTQTDTLLFGAGVTRANLRFSRGSGQYDNDLIIHYGNRGDQITVTTGHRYLNRGYFYQGDYSYNLQSRLTRVRFADGSEADLTSLITNYMNGRSKSAITGTQGNDTLFGGDGNDVIKGGKGNDLLIGGAGNDKLIGGKGNDTLVGGLGRDTLTGSAGRDVFRFEAPLDKKKTNADVITDFKHGKDRIHLSLAIFTKLTEGRLKKKFFTANAKGKALDRNDYIIYNTRTGALLYDKDGKGGAAAVQIAKLRGKPKLTAGDIFAKP